jgi:regulator of sigma E protease
MTDDRTQAGAIRRSSPKNGGDASGAPPERTRLSFWSLVLAGGVLLALVFGQWVILVAILGLALLITVHEFGHFLAAKAFGMRVEKFYVGFPPAALRRTWGETEYGFGIIAGGGFCKISGMTPEEEVPDGTGDHVYYKKPVWQRNVTIAAGPLMNIAAAVVILVLFIGIQGVSSASMTLDEVVEGTPAAKIGLTAGATILGADEQRWTEWEQASGYFAARPGETIRLTYRPAPVNGVVQAPTTVEVTLAENPQQPGSGYLGVRAGVVTQRPSPWRAVWLGITGTKDIVAGTFTGFWWLFTGKISATGPDGAVGPIGIVDVSRDAVQQDWYPVLLAFLSVNLGIINLIPILPFDGGHIVVNVLEKVRRKRLDTRVLERVMAFGTVLLVMLFLFLTFNDIKRIFGG